MPNLDGADRKVLNCCLLLPEEKRRRVFLTLARGAYSGISSEMFGIGSGLPSAIALARR